MKKNIRKTWAIRIAVIIILIPVASFALYFSAVFVGALIPAVPAGSRNPIIESGEQAGSRALYTIFFIDNTYHVEICLPASLCPFRDEISEARGDAGPESGYYCFGWGERKFYPVTPFLENLNLGMAADALFTPSRAAIRISFYDGPISGEVVTPHQADRRTVEQLYEYIDSYLERLPSHDFSVIPPGTVHEVYGDSLFINAAGRYSLFNTCNNWTAGAMKYAGIPTGLWTPLAWGVLRE